MQEFIITLKTGEQHNREENSYLIRRQYVLGVSVNRSRNKQHRKHVNKLRIGEVVKANR